MTALQCNPVPPHCSPTVGFGHTEEAKADFTTASNPKFNQPTARKLAQKALADMQ